MKQILFTLLLISVSLPAVAQLFPVESQIVVRPPSSVYLSDFTELGSERLSLMLNFNDTNEPDYDVRLHLRLEGAGVVLETSPNFNPAPLTLRPDGMRNLELIEWAEYLDPNNLTIVGLDEGQFRTSGGKLPEGMYQLCLTVRDYRRSDVALSRVNCTVLNLRKNNPPQAFVPTCGGTVQPTPNNQVQLNWQANHDALVNAQYTIDMVKVEPGQDPNQAIISGSQRLLPDVEVNNVTSYTIDPADPMSAELIYGETYAYRINVTDLAGLTTFENDGIGEVCWFTYGFLPGGLLGINFPQENGRVNPSQPLTFRWNGPTNAVAGTRIYYKLQVADITDLPEGADPGEALLNPNLLIDEQTSVTGNLSSWNFTYDGSLETERKLVWKVEAYVDGGSEDQEPLARSEVVSFQTTPLLDRFRAGQYTVLVNTAGNSTVDDFSGTGTVQINSELNIDVQFEHLVILQQSTSNVLQEGLIISPINEDIILDHQDGGSFFAANQIELDKDNLRVRGRITHQFGLNAENEPSAYAKIQSAERTLGFEGGRLIGSGNFEAKTIQPVDLPGLTIQYDASSTWSVDQSVLEYSFNGKYQLLDPVSHMEGQTVEYAFSEQTSLYRQNLVFPNLGQELLLMNSDRMSLLVKVLQIDFLMGESPEGSGLDDDWLGLYVKTGRVVIPTDFDAAGAIIPLEEISFGVQELEEPVVFTGRLSLNLDHTFANNNRPRASFYGFLDDWYGITFGMDQGILTGGELRGVVAIPFISETDRFGYSVPMTDNGFEVASFTAADGIVIDFDGGNTLSRDDLSITVKSGHFYGNDQLVLSVDIYLNAFEATLEHVENLTLWGDGAVGFNGVKHGLCFISDHIGVNINNFSGDLKSFGISYRNSTESIQSGAPAPADMNVWSRRVQYLFTYEANVNFGMFLSSQIPGNSPKTAFKLDQYRDISVLLPDDYTSSLEAEVTSMPDEWTDYWEALQAAEEVEEDPDFFNEEGLPLLLAQVATAHLPGVANVSIGNLQAIYDEEEWGHLFALEASVELMRPFATTIGITVFAGHTPWVTNPSEGFAYTAVKLSIKDGTIGDSQGLDNQLAAARTRSLSIYREGNFEQGDNMTSGGRVNIGPVQVRFLAVGVYINMNYDSGGKLQPSRDSYGGLISFKGRTGVPPGSTYVPNESNGKQQIEFGFTLEVIVNASLGFQSVSGDLSLKYTEDAAVDSSGGNLGGNSASIVLSGGFDWNSMLFRSNAQVDIAFAPLCLSASGGVDFQLDPTTQKLRMLDVRLGSYDNRNVAEYCQIVTGGGGSGMGGAIGIVAWIQLTMGYDLPANALPAGRTSYEGLTANWRDLDTQMDAYNTLSASERAIIAAAIEDPASLPEEIRNSDNYQQIVRTFENDFGVQVWNGEVGLGLTARIEARTSSWFDLVVIRVMPYFTAEASIVAWGNIQVAPVLVFNELGVELNGNASIGVYYEELNGLEYSGNVKTWTLLSITLQAQAIMDVQAEYVEGSLNAQVQFIQLPTGGFLVDIPVEIPFEFSTAPN